MVLLVQIRIQAENILKRFISGKNKSFRHYSSRNQQELSPFLVFSKINEYNSLLLLIKYKKYEDNFLNITLRML